MDSQKLVVLFLLILSDLIYTSFSTTLPVDPKFFQNLVRDRDTFDNFLLSNANIGRAQVNCCRPPKPPNPNITSPPPQPTEEPAPEQRNMEKEPITESAAIFFQDKTTTIPSPYWVVGECLNDFRVADVIRRVVGGGKVIMLWVNDLCDDEWDVLYNQVVEQKSILIYWNIATGPGVGSFDVSPMKVPENAAGLPGVVLGFLEGTSVADNEDDRYWDYHFDQMAALMSTYPLSNITTKLIAFNGLYLARSLAETIGNCSKATGFFHYINNKDMVRLLPRYYQRRLEAFGFRSAYNIWGVSEFFAPDFSGTERITGFKVPLIVVLIQLSWTYTGQ